MSDVIVRDARAQDAARISELAGQLGYPCTAEQITPRLARYGAGGMARIFVAEGDLGAGSARVVGDPGGARSTEGESSADSVRNAEASGCREQGSCILGWTSAELADHFYTPRYVEISGLIVDAEARGRGIGALLLRAVEAWAAELGVPSVRLRANIVRVDAHRFYEREGFARRKTQYMFEKAL